MTSLKKTILIADDDIPFRFNIKCFLEEYDFTILEAENVEQVIANATSADIWIIDARLPSSQYEGIQVLNDLYQKNIRPKYKVIFISAAPKDLAQIFLNGLPQEIEYDWIEKPFELEYLYHKIETILE